MVNFSIECEGRLSPLLHIHLLFSFLFSFFLEGIFSLMRFSILFTLDSGLRSQTTGNFSSLFF
jgi:hypothetical protein